MTRFRWWGGVVGCLAVTACAGPADGAGPETVENAEREFSVRVSDGIALWGVQEGTGHSGIPLVVLHGGPGMDHRYLRPLIDSLALHRHVIAPDQRGTGLSEAPLTSDAVHFDALIEDIDRVRQWAGAEQIDLIGHSWGTTLAYHYALRFPDRVRRMVVVAPVEPGVRYATAAQERRAAALDSTTAAELSAVQASPGFSSGDPETIRRFYELAFRPLLHDPSRRLEVPLADRSARNGFAVMGALQGAMPDPDLWPRMTDIGAPTLVVHGRADAYPVEMVEELVAELGDGSLVIIEEAGHFPYIESPAEFFTPVRVFLGPDEGS